MQYFNVKRVRRENKVEPWLYLSLTPSSVWAISDFLNNLALLYSPLIVLKYRQAVLLNFLIIAPRHFLIFAFQRINNLAPPPLKSTHLRVVTIRIKTRDHQSF